MFTIGSGIGVCLATLFNLALPQDAGIESQDGIQLYSFIIALDVSIAALVGMGSMFSGTSRAALMSITFAVESTGQIKALTPRNIPGKYRNFTYVLVQWLEDALQQCWCLGRKGTQS